MARVIAPKYPHHITQRGNRRQPVFFKDSDYKLYLQLMAESCARFHVAIWAYCLMPNHTHLIAVPEDETGLRQAVGEAHRRYTCQINAREGWSGFLWQGRFASCPMDERHLLAAAKYVELNPVRAKLAGRAEDYQWSSARAHLARKDDALVRVSALTDIVGDWKKFLSGPECEADIEALNRHSKTGRPCGGEAFVAELENRLGLDLRKHKRGPKKKTN